VCALLGNHARPLAASLVVVADLAENLVNPSVFPCGIKVIRSTPTCRIMNPGIPECRTAGVPITGVPIARRVCVQWGGVKPGFGLMGWRTGVPITPHCAPGLRAMGWRQARFWLDGVEDRVPITPHCAPGLRAMGWRQARFWLDGVEASAARIFISKTHDSGHAGLLFAN
jgi:hypothetical protein